MILLRDSMRAVVALVMLIASGPAVRAAEVKLLPRQHDPYGCPRPGPGQEHVPLRSTFYLELGLSGAAAGDVVVPDSVSIQLQPEGGEAFFVLRENQRFPAGYSGRLYPGKGTPAGVPLVVWVDPQPELLANTRYTMRVTARSRQGAELPAMAGEWQFTTEAPPEVHPLRISLSLANPSTRWHGAFFSGFCGTSFTTNFANRIPTFELMDQVRESAPKAWSLQRDFWLTGMDHQPQLLGQNLPNIVRELETRRISAIERHGDGVLLRVEDFFGHEQYGIAGGRPLSGDYQIGDEVLVADGVHDARAQVIAVDDRRSTMVVSAFEQPAAGWKIEYAGPLPRAEDVNAPGWFPPGGCYLRKLRPAGTPTYYWGRLDKEWDLAHRRFGRRLMPNFADAPGDLAIDGRNWTTAKDYAELHSAVYAISSHIIERYGDACLEFPWSVFNEPDLINFFWRSDWIELQKFYDYTVDAILRAFEDRGYDSDRVFVGGLELGGIFGAHLRLREFLAHCSPRAAPVKDALMHNAAFADERLDGKRSQRVEALCRAHNGRGAPCDFVSVHSYNRSQLMADKLLRAKEMALETDAEYYADLWVNSHEACPGWDLPPDPAFSDSYLGNGYFPTWCADVARRLLQRTTTDPRFGYGESILTFWPWPSPNFEGRNDCVRQIQVDENGDGASDHAVTVPMPILHFLGLLNRMGDSYWVFPEHTVSGHVVSGFASRTQDKLCILVYSHHALDTESRSDREFAVTLEINHLPWPHVVARQFRFDKQHNSYFELARSRREQEAAGKGSPPAELTAQVQQALRDLNSNSRDEQLQALSQLEGLGQAAAQAAGAVLMAVSKTNDETLRKRGAEVLKRITAPAPHPADIVRQVQALAQLRETHSDRYPSVPGGRLTLDIVLAGNGANFLIIEPDATPARSNETATPSRHPQHDPRSMP